MRRMSWTVAAACAAAVTIGGARLVGTDGHGNENRDGASSFARANLERPACTLRTLRGSFPVLERIRWKTTVQERSRSMGQRSTCSCQRTGMTFR